MAKKNPDTALKAAVQREIELIEQKMRFSPSLSEESKAKFEAKIAKQIQFYEDATGKKWDEPPKNSLAKKYGRPLTAKEASLRKTLLKAIKSCKEQIAACPENSDRAEYLKERIEDYEQRWEDQTGLLWKD